MENIKTFFDAEAIALIGASDHEEKVGGILAKKIIQAGAKLIPINPNHNEIFGVPCYSKLSDYKKKIDLAVIAIPAPLVADALEECGKKEIKSAILISAGFAEIGNKEGEDKLLEIAQRYKIRILGPNCFGICNPSKNLDMTFSATMPEKGGVAFISQSGALWSYIADYSIGKFGFSGFASLGNMADLEFSDFLEYFCGDKKTKSIVIYVEKLNDGKKFMKDCLRCSKPIYAVKAGSSKEGEKAAISHTASLASDYMIYKGAFKQSGVVLCETFLEAFEKASGRKLVKKEAGPVKIGKRVFIITNAGGAGALMSDYLSEKGFHITSSEALELKSPLDLLGTALAEDYKTSLEKLKAQDFFDSIVIILTAQSMTEIEKTAQAIAEFKKQTGKDLVAVFLGDKSVNEARKIIEKAGIIFFNTLEEAKERLILK